MESLRQKTKKKLSKSQNGNGIVFACIILLCNFASIVRRTRCLSISITGYVRIGKERRNLARPFGRAHLQSGLVLIFFFSFSRLHSWAVCSWRVTINWHPCSVWCLFWHWPCICVTDSRKGWRTIHLQSDSRNLITHHCIALLDHLLCWRYCGACLELC